jgi:hypothetical protein
MDRASQQLHLALSVDEFWAQRATEIPRPNAYLRASLLNATVGAKARRLDLYQVLGDLTPPFGLLPVAELEKRLTDHPTVNRYLGRFLRAACVGEQISQEHLPADWATTEASLKAIVDNVDLEGFVAHCDQNYDTSPASLTALLAEVEAFGWLLRTSDRVEALCYRPRADSSAPEARAWRGGTPYLIEIKSLWAYGRLCHNDLIPNAAGVSATYSFLIGRAPHSRQERDLPHVRTARHNTRVLRQAIHRVLDDAAQQLDTYARQHSLSDQRLIVLATTYRQPVLGIVDAGIRIAQAWLHRHPTVTDVIYLSAGESRSAHAHLRPPARVRVLGQTQ